jgi:ubiquinone/menaquinone biosynthesis C-methylase UbiE
MVSNVKNDFSYPRRMRRERELELMLQLANIGLDTRILDIGCGAGYQTSLLRGIGYDVTCIDMVNVVKYTQLDVICDCSYLPFKDNCFNAIYSSHLLEHVRDKDKALQEMIRVLDRHGSLYVIVPTWIWKVGHLLAYYPNLVVRLASWISKRDKKHPSSGVSTKGAHRFRGLRWLYTKVRQNLLPEVHGTAPSNLEEVRAYRISSWINLFQRNGLKINRLVMGPLYIPTEIPSPTVNAARFGMGSSLIVELSHSKTSIMQTENSASSD